MPASTSAPLSRTGPPRAKPSCQLAPDPCYVKTSPIIDPKAFGFFTLGQLCEYLNIEDRQNVRDVTVHAGAPYVTRGRETWFPMDLWAEWLRTIHVRSTPTVELEPTTIPLLGATVRNSV